MNFGFLFWLFLIGLIIASLQDLKRREVDDWLNLFLIISSFSFLFFRAIFENNTSIIFQLSFALIILFIIMGLFYFGRIFAGGDAKLLFAMTAFFVGINFYETLINIGMFVLLLMISGSLYGITYSFVLYLKDYKKVNDKIRKNFLVFETKLFLVFGTILILLGFFHSIFIILGVLLFVFPLLYVFAKGLEEVSMIKMISGSELREGDWLAADVHVGKRVILASWEGLSLKDIQLMKDMRKVKIKQGLPFVPAFLIAFIFYNFYNFLEFIF